MTKELLQAIRQAVATVISMTTYNANKEQLLDCPDYLAYEIIDLTEICSPDVSVQRHVASKVLQHGWAQGTARIVKNYFELAY